MIQLRRHYRAPRPNPTFMVANIHAHGSDRLHRLSPRERQICELVAADHNIAAARSALGIARSTMYIHLRSIREKLGVTTLSQIIAATRASHLEGQ